MSEKILIDALVGIIGKYRDIPELVNFARSALMRYEASQPVAPNVVPSEVSVASS